MLGSEPCFSFANLALYSWTLYSDFLGIRSFFMLLWLRQTPADTLFCLKLESSHRSTIINTKIPEIQVLEATISKVAPSGTIGNIFIDLYCC